MIKRLSIAAIILSAFISTIYSNERELFAPGVAQRFRVKEIYLGMTVDNLREITESKNHHVFRDCTEKRNYGFGYMYCSNNESGFRFDKYGRLTRFWFGINQAEKLFGTKFRSQKEYVAFVKSKFHIKTLVERDGKPEIDPARSKPKARKIYSLEINRSDYLEINENSTLTIGKSGVDEPMRFD
jgi:hypothetical protein